MLCLAVSRRLPLPPKKALYRSCSECGQCSTKFYNVRARDYCSQIFSEIYLALEYYNPIFKAILFTNSEGDLLCERNRRYKNGLASIRNLLWA